MRSLAYYWVWWDEYHCDENYIPSGFCDQFLDPQIYGSFSSYVNMYFWMQPLKWWIFKRIAGKILKRKILDKWAMDVIKALWDEEPRKAAILSYIMGIPSLENILLYSE